MNNVSLTLPQQQLQLWSLKWDLSTLRTGFVLLTSSLSSADLLEPGKLVSLFFPYAGKRRGRRRKQSNWLCMQRIYQSYISWKILKNVLILTAIFLQNMRILLNLPVNQCPWCLTFLQRFLLEEAKTMIAKIPHPDSSSVVSEKKYSAISFHILHSYILRQNWHR